MEAKTDIPAEAYNYVKDLWDVTVYLDKGVCFTYGYFRSKENAVSFAKSVRDKPAFAKPLEKELHGNLVELEPDSLVWVDPDFITAIEIGHPMAWEVAHSWWSKNGRQAWNRGGIG